MNIWLHFIVPVVGILIVNTIMRIIYKDVEKKDKGFVLAYHKLSYRRKYIRSLWGIPFVLLLYLALHWLIDLTPYESSIIGILFILLISMDVAFNYIKWKKNEKSG